MAGAAPVSVRASRLGLARALRNLMINAATHGVRASVSVDGAQGVMARIVIEDEGPGIAPELIGQVFEPFFRADPARRQNIPGAGLGLTIAREIIRHTAGARADRIHHQRLAGQPARRPLAPGHREVADAEPLGRSDHTVGGPDVEQPTANVGIAERAERLIIVTSEGPEGEAPEDAAARLGEGAGPRPDLDLDRFSQPRIEASRIDVDFHHLDAEHLPFEAERFDTVVSTLTLCSIPDVVHALGEIRRVLKPGGQFLFLEHGRAPDESVARWQDRITPAWKPLGGGCHLNRPMRELVQNAGLRLDPVQNYYLRGLPRIFGYMTEGVARRE